MTPFARRIALSAAVVVAAVLMTAAVFVASDWVFWDRYLRAYTFQSYVDHPFPHPARLYPQETVAGAAAPRELPHSEGGERTISGQALEAAARFAEETRSTALLVAHRGRVQLEHYWHGAGPETFLDSFSMHKTVVGLLTGVAIHEGFIGGVDEPLSEYLPEWSSDPRGAIRLRHLLQMNSGFEPMQFPKNPFSKHVQRQIGTHLAETALSFEVVDRPGAAFDYNGVNPTLLVMILQRATGMRYSEYLSTRLWRPLGNHHAAVWLDREGGLARGATSLFAVARDWLRIGEIMRNGGRVDGVQVVPAAWIEEMMAPSPTNPLYGYLMWIGTQYAEERTLAAFRGFAATAEAPFRAPDVAYLDGLGGQRVYIIPSRELVIVRSGILAREWEDAHLPNLIIEGIQ